MNILQTIWSALTTPNEPLTRVLFIPLCFLDVFIGMYFFTTALNIKSTTKQKLLYVIINGVIACINNFFIPSSYKIFVNIILWPILIFFVFKSSIIKSIIAMAITLSISIVLESIFANLFLILFNLSSQDAVTIPIFRIIIALTIYLFVFLITKLISFLKVNINIIEHLSKKNKILLIVSLLLIILVLCLQFCLVIFYSNTMPLLVSSINIIFLIIYFSISICNIVSISNLEVTKRNLENANNTIHSLKILHDQVRSFKHDFDNMVNSIGGYVVNEDISGLKKYYNQLLEECHKTNNLYALSPEVINHPAIYHLLATKYYDADQLNIQINLDVFLDLNEIESRMKILDFTRILGILLDNAIEAAKECEEKKINVIFRKEPSNNDRILVIIQNTYANKDVSTENIFQKGITSKENHSGLGLWKIRQILMHNNNLNLFTTKDSEFFTQQFEIFK